MDEKRRSDHATPGAFNTLVSRVTPVGIVLLEDSDDDVALIRKELARSDINFRLRTVSSRQELEAALLSNPDLVLADYWLPDISGEEALEICKRLSPDIPFILLS